MRAKFVGRDEYFTGGQVYDVEPVDSVRGYRVNDDDEDARWVPAEEFEVIPDEPSAEPAATTNVVIDGPGEYVTRRGGIEKIVGPNETGVYVESHPWLAGSGRTYEASGHYEDEDHVDSIHDIVRKTVMPSSQPETKPSNPKDVIGSTKPPLSCIPTGPLYEVGAAMLDGSAKYGRHNWRVIGVRSSVYYDAALRHLMKWWEGEELDTDSGCHHLAHAVACCLIVRDAANLGQLTDDRPVPGGDPTAGVKELIKQIKERYPEPVPPFLASQM